MESKKLFSITFFFLLLTFNLCMAQGEGRKQKNHIIVALDRTGGMMPERKSEMVEVIDYVNQFCFQSGAVETGTSLLIPGHDYLSVFPFGLKEGQKTMGSFIRKRDPLYTRMKSDFSTSFFTEQLNNNYYYWNRWRYNKTLYGGASLSIPLGLKEFENNTVPFNKTYFILIYDGQYTTENTAQELQYMVNSNFIYDSEQEKAEKIIGTISKDFNYKLLKSERVRRQTSESYQGPNYLIKLYEIVPKITGANIQSILNYLEEERTPLQKLPDGNYAGILNIRKKASDQFKPLQLKIKADPADLLENYIIDMSNDSSGFYKKNLLVDRGESEVVNVSAALTTAFQSPYYKGTVLTPETNAELINDFSWSYENDAKVIGIFGLGSWMYRLIPRGGDQFKSAYLWSTIILILIILILTHYTYLLFFDTKLKEEEIELI